MMSGGEGWGRCRTHCRGDAGSEVESGKGGEERGTGTGGLKEGGEGQGVTNAEELTPGGKIVYLARTLHVQGSRRSRRRCVIVRHCGSNGCEVGEGQWEWK